MRILTNQPQLVSDLKNPSSFMYTDAAASHGGDGNVTLVLVSLSVSVSVSELDLCYKSNNPADRQIWLSKRHVLPKRILSCAYFHFIHQTSNLTMTSDHHTLPSPHPSHDLGVQYVLLQL